MKTKIHFTWVSIVVAFLSATAAARAGYLTVSPPDGTQFGTSVAGPHGYAYDPAGVDKVQFTINAPDSWQTIEEKVGPLGGTNFWATKTVLSPGTNSILVRTLLSDGTVSATAQVNYFYAPSLKNFETVPPGGTVTLQIPDALPSDTTFQWQFNESDIEGATARYLVIFNASMADQGRYRVVLNSSSFGTVTTSETLLKISSLVFWGRSDSLVPPDGLTDVRAIAAGDTHVVCLKNDGTCLAIGDEFGSYTPITNVPPGLSNVVAIAAASENSLALKDDGTVVWWGLRQGSVELPPAGLSNVVGIACGINFNVALKADGTVTQWSLVPTPTANWPIVTDPTGGGISNVIAIAGGAENWIALKSDGTVVLYYNENNGWAGIAPHPVAGISNAVSVGCGAEHAMVVLADGTVRAFGGENLAGELNVPRGLSGVVAVTGGWYFSYALKNDGSVVAWGEGSNGQCDVPNGINAVQVAAGTPFGVALANNTPRMINFRIGKGPADKQPPTLTVQLPRPNSRTTGATLTGFCNEQSAITHVWYTLTQNGTPTVTNDVAVTGVLSHVQKHKWTFSAPLFPQPGTNILTVQAQDTWGNLSRVVKRTFVDEVPVPFDLSIASGGSGKVLLAGVTAPSRPIKVNSLGAGTSTIANIFIGETYKLKAQAGTQSKFQSWSGVTNSTNSQFTFVAQPGMSAQASFLVTPKK
jgi:hypothetical protein